MNNLLSSKYFIISSVLIILICAICVVLTGAKLGLAVGIIACAIAVLIKGAESRMVLFCTGVILCFLAGSPMESMHAFSTAIKRYKVIEPIVAAMGFAYVLKLTKCDQHLVHALAKPLSKMGIFLVPAAVLVTAFINISITSSSGCSAAVGAVIIPLLMRSGVHPAVAASTVFLGTYGSANLNPGYAQTIIASEVSGASVMEVIEYEAKYFGISALICAVALMAVAIILKEHRGHGSDEEGAVKFKVNIIKAIIPLLPVVMLLVLNNSSVHAAIKAHGIDMPKLAISHAMIISSFLAFLTCLREVKPADVVKQFCAGMGNGFSHVYGIIICAMIFVAGLTAVGLVDALKDAMKASTTMAGIAGPAGTFILALVTGSGDAAGQAFNLAVTKHAKDFGLDPMHLASAVNAVAGLGRSMSPIAGAAIICAGYANVNPLELAKRNALPCIIAAVIYVLLTLH